MDLKHLLEEFMGILHYRVFTNEPCEGNNMLIEATTDISML